MSSLMAFDRLEDVVGDDESMIREIVALFIDTTKIYLDRLRHASEQDPADWPEAAHALKGCCGNFGAIALADLAKRCEQEDPSQERVIELSQLFAQTRQLLVTRYEGAVA